MKVAQFWDWDWWTSLQCLLAIWYIVKLNCIYYVSFMVGMTPGTGQTDIFKIYTVKSIFRRPSATWQPSGILSDLIQIYMVQFDNMVADWDITKQGNRSSHLGIHKQTNACWSLPRSQTVFYHLKICRKWELRSLCYGPLLPFHKWSNVFVGGETKLIFKKKGLGVLYK